MRSLAWSLLLGAAAGLQYQGAQAPPPAAAPRCDGWCPKWTCCKLCDDPACSGCGATRQCAGNVATPTAAAATPSSAATPTATTFSDASGLNIAPPGFETGTDGRLMANGKEFVIKGINWWGTEGPTRVFGGLRKRSMDGLLDFIQEQGFNAIRILVSHHAVLINGKIAAGEYDEGRTPELVNLRYLDQIDLFMRKAADRRLLVMINAHRTIPTAWPGEGMWYDGSVSESRVINSWQKLSQVFCSHWNFFAADLANEPRKASWGRGRPTDWNKAAERLGNVVLNYCPRLLIFVQGVAADPGAPEDGGVAQGYFWGENLFGVHSAPVQLADMSKLVYSPHTYGPGTVAQQSYFPTCSGGGCGHAGGFPNNMPAIWDRHFGFVAEKTKQAVVIGEFGGVYTGYDRQWQDEFVDYLKRKGFGAFYFGLNPDSDDTGGLLHRDWRSEENAKLALIKKMSGTKVATIIGEEPPSPSPPTPPPPLLPPPPSPLVSSALLELFKQSPPPPLANVQPSPPPPPPRHSGRDSVPHWQQQQQRQPTLEQREHSTAPIVLGAATLVAPPSPAMKEAGTFDVSASTATMWVLIPIVAFMVLRQLKGSSVSGSGSTVLPPNVSKAALRAVRPRQAKSPEYNRVALEPNRDDVERGERAARSSKPRKERAPKERVEPEEPVVTLPAEAEVSPVEEPDDPSPVSPRTRGLDADEHLRPGMQVRIVGLQNAREHNGKGGVLIAPVATPSGTRWNLRLESGELLALKPTNLETSGVSPSMQKMIEALERAGELDKAAMLRSVLPDAPDDDD